MSWPMDRQKWTNRLVSALLYKEAGKVTKSVGLLYEAYLPGASVGSKCRILATPGTELSEGIEAEVIGFRDRRVHAHAL